MGVGAASVQAEVQADCSASAAAAPCHCQQCRARTWWQQPLHSAGQPRDKVQQGEQGAECQAGAVAGGDGEGLAGQDAPRRQRLADAVALCSKRGLKQSIKQTGALRPPASAQRPIRFRAASASRPSQADPPASTGAAAPGGSACHSSASCRSCLPTMASGARGCSRPYCNAVAIWGVEGRAGSSQQCGRGSAAMLPVSGQNSCTNAAAPAAPEGR